jgi:hypothetical protein
MDISIEEINEFFWRKLVMCALDENASHITIDSDENYNTITVTNDGNGLQHIDFLSQMMDGGPYWLENNKAHQCAFYAGATLITQKMTIESGALIMSIETHNLESQRVSVSEAPKRSDTKLTVVGSFEGSLLPVKFLKFNAMGLTIPIIFNGKEVERPLALDGKLKFSKTDIGNVHVAKSEGRPIEDLAIVMFLNGLARRIFEDRKENDLVKHVVHVDPEHPTLQALTPEELVKLVRGTITKLAKQLSIG